MLLKFIKKRNIFNRYYEVYLKFKLFYFKSTKYDLNLINLFLEKKFRRSILDICITLDNIIPHYCYHFNLSIAGNCRMCLIELSTSLKPVVACAVNLNINQQINTNTLLVTRARQGIMEFLLVNHPLDCPICDQGGECDLQDQSLIYGSDRGRSFIFLI